MKKLILIVLGLAGLFSVSLLSGQTTNSAPVVDQSVSATVTNFSPGVIWASPTTTAGYVTSYLAPLTTAAGLTTPANAVPQKIIITFFNDGSSEMQTSYALPTALRPPPPNFGK